jgi:tRNA-dihydrouridine synthase 3
VPASTSAAAPARWDADKIRQSVENVGLEAGTGIVPVKAEYIRERTVEGTVDADGNRLRGQNKDREFAKLERTGSKPTFEGERNFMFDVLPKLKKVKQLPEWTGRRDRNEEAAAQQQAKPQPAAEQPAVEATSEAAAAPVEPKPEEAPTTVVPADAAPRRERNNVVSYPVKRSDEPAEERRKRLFSDKLVLAPLTTVGNLPFRRVCVDYGVDVTVGEMAVASNLTQTQASEWSLLRRHESEKIFGIQVACAKGFEATRLAAMLEASDFSYDYVDVNCGCPVDLIVRKGCGCGLWERKGRMRDVVQSLVAGQGRPVTIKCRVGPDEADPQLHKVIHEYATWGADAVTIHGRSRKQRYTKLGNWGYVEQCAQLTDLPVIGNGDLFTLQGYQERRAKAPHVTSHMIARGALIKPWIFREIKTETVLDVRSPERLEMLRSFANYGLMHWGSDEKGVETTRRYLCEWISFLCRYVPVGLLEQQPQHMNDRPPHYVGRDDLETLMASDLAEDWIKLSEMLLGPAGPNFKFTPKHKSNSYSAAGTNNNSAPLQVEG